MKILYVTGSCLRNNTSANMSHNAFIKGFIENGHEVDVIMASDSWGETDKRLANINNVIYHEYSTISFGDKLKKIFKEQEKSSTNHILSQNNESPAKNNLSNSFRSILKRIFYTVFKPDTLYPLEKKWIQNASGFHSDIEYDLLVSNSSPAASHKLAEKLILKKYVHCKKWIQIWEDPWFYDLYGGLPLKVKEEEHNLLKKADVIYYVSPLTLHYQKKHFSDCAEKMKSVPLPYFSIDSDDKPGFENKTHNKELSFGYFGDYYSQTRNILPFYSAVNTNLCTCYIFGDSDLSLQSNDKIIVSKRVTLDKLALIQKKTDVLVHLCNLKGGQIPGKIYHYSATNKPILFILDGTEEEKKILYNYFRAFNRYYFCDNNTISINNAINSIISHYNTDSFEPVNDFSPKCVASMILKG